MTAAYLVQVHLVVHENNAICASIRLNNMIASHTIEHIRGLMKTIPLSGPQKTICGMEIDVIFISTSTSPCNILTKMTVP